jgi:hypothetical protein
VSKKFLALAHDGDSTRKKDEIGMIMAGSASVGVENNHAVA